MSTTMDEPVGHLAAEHPSVRGSLGSLRRAARVLLALPLVWTAVASGATPATAPAGVAAATPGSHALTLTSMESAAQHFSTSPPASEQVAR